MNNIITGSYTSIEQAANSIKNNGQKEAGSVAGMSFSDILANRKSIASVVDSSSLYGTRVKFSKHADARLKQRDIELSDEQLQRLNEGAAKAGKKGIRESLVLLDDLAFIVNIQNNTVVTAMDATNSEENIYTNIDGAVII